MSGDSDIKPAERLSAYREDQADLLAFDGGEPDECQNPACNREANLVQMRGGWYCAICVDADADPGADLDLSEVSP
jgi:hypothetical protein